MVKRKYHRKHPSTRLGVKKEEKVQEQEVPIVVKDLPTSIVGEAKIEVIPNNNPDAEYNRGVEDGRALMMVALKETGKQVRKDPQRGLIVIKDGNDNLLFRSKASSGTVVFIPDEE